jgi:hypothetical protein
MVQMLVEMFGRAQMMRGCFRESAEFLRFLSRREARA